MARILTPTGWKDVLDEGRKCHLIVNGKPYGSFPNMEAAERAQETVLRKNPNAKTIIDTKEPKKPESTKFSPPGRWINEETEEDFYKESDAWHAGLAYQPGEKNPHKRGTNLHRAWNNGRREADRQDRESMKEESINFDEMTDEEILDLLEQFSDEELEELEEQLKRQGLRDVFPKVPEPVLHVIDNGLDHQAATRAQRATAKKARAENKKIARENLKTSPIRPHPSAPVGSSAAKRLADRTNTWADGRMNEETKKLAK